MIVVAVAALVGGRLYHVIDQWQLYKDDPLKIVLPPYSGLGVYGGIIAGTVAAVLYARSMAPRRTCRGASRSSAATGPKATLCPPGSDPTATLGQHFQPMFLYESLSGPIGALVLIWLARRFAGRLRPGDLLLVFFIWYGSVRFLVESLKTNNWLFFGVPTAQIIAAITVGGAAAILVIRHRRPRGGWTARRDS